MSADAFHLELTTADTAAPVLNLYPLHLHDIAAYEQRRPNRHGVYADGDDVETIAELLDRMATFWQKPELLFPYLIRVEGVAAGFFLIASGPYVPVPDVDFIAFEFFVTHAFRGDGTAVRAARDGIARHPGRWEIVTYPGAERPIAFWRKVLPMCATGEIVETEEDHPFGRKVVFRFSNRPTA